MTQLKNQKFVCIDCETTGLDPKEDRIIEVAFLCFDGENEYERFESLVDPKCTIPESSIAIHHISQEMVEGKPSIQDILPDMLRQINGHIIVGHGIQFDIDILANAAQRHGIACSIRENRFIDTLRLARLYGKSPVNSLEYLRQHFNIPLEGAHRAMSDVIVNKEVFRHLSKKFKNLNEIFDTLSKPILMANIPFGKHKGRSFRDVPLPYLLWMSHQEFDQDLMFSVQTELKRRRRGDGFEQATNPFKGL